MTGGNLHVWLIPRFILLHNCRQQMCVLYMWSNSTALYGFIKKPCLMFSYDNLLKVPITVYFLSASELNEEISLAFFSLFAILKVSVISIPLKW